MNAIFSGNIHVAAGGGGKRLPIREPMRIDHCGAQTAREEELENNRNEVKPFRVVALHSDCESGVGTEEMLRRLVWPYSVFCFGVEDVDDYLSRMSDRKYRKLNEQMIAEIRTRAAAGERQKDLALEYGVSSTHINKLVNRKWA